MGTFVIILWIIIFSGIIYNAISRRGSRQRAQKMGQPSQHAPQSVQVPSPPTRNSATWNGGSCVTPGQTVICDVSRLDPHLLPLAHLVGRTFRSISGIHTVRWELALGGTAICGVSSFSNGEHGQVTLAWNPQRQMISVSGVMNDGSVSQGNGQIINGHYITHFLLPGNPGGASEMLGDVVFLPNGDYHQTGKQKIGGHWRQDISDTYHRIA